jgi:hypothetical protein
MNTTIQNILGQWIFMNDEKTLLKSKYPQIILWNCLNHRLKLAVSDTITAIDGTQPIEDFFGRIYTIYSHSAKLQR